MTTEDIRNFMSENPEASKEILDGFKETHIIRTKDEDATWRQNYEQDIVSKKTREFAENLEKDVFELSGLEKEDGEKYHAYNKRAYTSLSEKAKRVKTLEAKIEELQSQNADETLKKELDQYKAKISEMTEAHAKEKERIFADFNNDKKSLEIKSATKSLEFGDYPESILSRAIKDVQQEIMSMPSKVVEGSTVFLDENGDIMKHQDSFENVTASDLVKERLSDIIKKPEETKKGLGLKEPEKKGDTFAMPSDVTTKTQLNRYLVDKKGLAVTSPEYKEIFREYSKDLPLR